MTVLTGELTFPQSTTEQAGIKHNYWSIAIKWIPNDTLTVES